MAGTATRNIRCRWWDGTQWTAHTQPVAQPPAEQRPVVAAPAATTPAPAPTPVISVRSEVALDAGQVEYLGRLASFRGLFSKAFEWALYVPIALFLFGVGLTKVVLYVPLVGWVFAIWAFAGTLAAALVTGILTPVFALILLPVTMSKRKPLLTADVQLQR